MHKLKYAYILVNFPNFGPPQKRIKKKEWYHNATSLYHALDTDPNSFINSLGS